MTDQKWRINGKCPECGIKISVPASGDVATLFGPLGVIKCARCHNDLLVLVEYGELKFSKIGGGEKWPKINNGGG